MSFLSFLAERAPSPLRRISSSPRFVYIFATVWVFLLIAYWNTPENVVPQVFSASKIEPLGHPIERLIAQKRAYLESLLARQSRTYSEAVATYKKRYGIDPPLGYEWWWKLAQKHNHPLADEYDTFMDNIKPLRGVAPQILRDRMQMIQDSVPERIASYIFKGGAVEDKTFGYLDARGLPKMEDLRKIPYNFTAILNTWDESMVNVPYEEVDEAVASARKGKYMDSVADGSSYFIVDPILNTQGQNGWTAIEQACPYKSPSRRPNCPNTPSDAPLRFLDDPSVVNDLCQNCELIHEHGLLIRPANMKTARELVPIFSSNAPSNFRDILYPSPFYASTQGDYREDLDPEWSQKDSLFYWAGSATGGQLVESNWFMMQRQRLALKTQPTNTENIQTLKEVSAGRWVPNFVSMASLAKHFKVKITEIVQCLDSVACPIQEKAFGITKDFVKDSKEESYKHKFVFDIDGNGFSGRFYRLLESKSVVVKSTILREWHDDRLIPWVHYVPLSVGYRELPEMARFLAGTSTGLHLSERIAKESTRWKRTALRDIDQQLAMLRMLLEIGRIMNGTDE